MTTIGTCSLCGGPVQVPALWGGVIPPTPTCAHCGAVQRNSYGPVIEMVRPHTRTTIASVSSTGVMLREEWVQQNPQKPVDSTLREP